MSGLVTGSEAIPSPPPSRRHVDVLSSHGVARGRGGTSGARSDATPAERSERRSDHRPSAVAPCGDAPNAPGHADPYILVAFAGVAPEPTCVVSGFDPGPHDAARGRSRAPPACRGVADRRAKRVDATPERMPTCPLVGRAAIESSSTFERTRPRRAVHRRCIRRGRSGADLRRLRTRPRATRH